MSNEFHEKICLRGRLTELDGGFVEDFNTVAGQGIYTIGFPW
jgi:hypothetical protein